jgi:membrane protease YdiL (CAAX protease family)
LLDFSNKPLNYPDVALGFIMARALIALAVIWVFRKWIDRRPFLNLGFQFTPGWWRELLAGFGFSMAALLVIFLLSLALSAAAIVNFAWGQLDISAMIGGLVVGLAFNLLVGVAEESDARGYVLQNLAEGIRLVPAILVSSLYFGVLHLLNPGAGWLSTIGIFFAGVLLALGYYVTRRLWFSIGMHAAWNFAEGPLFGFPVSGLGMGGLFQLKITGPEWLMGGAFGPEAGALAVVVEIAMIAALVVWAHREDWDVDRRARTVVKKISSAFVRVYHRLKPK